MICGVDDTACVVTVFWPSPILIKYAVQSPSGDVNSASSSQQIQVPYSIQTIISVSKLPYPILWQVSRTSTPSPNLFL